MPAQTSYADLLKRSLIIVSAAVVPVLIWYLFGVVLMVFGAVILAMLLRLGARPLERWLRLPEWAALIMSGLIILAIIVATVYLFGTQISGQFQVVVQRTSSASAGIEKSLQGTAFGRYILDHLSSGNFSVTNVLPGLVKVSATFIEGVIIMIICGAYLAAQPGLYRTGAIWLFPPRHHSRAAEIFDGIAEA
ncbi:MAG: AI-2E family transporter, partial [Xanthobacteraceae bacterium]